MQAGGRRSAGLPEFVKTLFVIEHRAAGHVLIPDVHLVPGHARAGEHGVVVVKDVLRGVEALRVAEDGRGVAEIATAIGAGQAVVLPGSAAHEGPPHREDRGGGGGRFVADRSSAPVETERHECDVADREAGDHFAIGVGVEVLAINGAILRGVGGEGTGEKASANCRRVWAAAVARRISSGLG